MCDRIYHFKTIGPRSIKSPVELIKWSAGTRARIDQILQINLELFYINSLYQRLITTNIFYRHEQSTEEESSQFAAQGEYKKNINYFRHIPVINWIIFVVSSQTLMFNPSNDFTPLLNCPIPIGIINTFINNKKPKKNEFFSFLNRLFVFTFFLDAYILKVEQ